MKNFIQKLFNNLSLSKKNYSKNRFCIYDFANPIWTKKGYSQFSEEAYKKNVIANRCVSLIARSAASVDWLAFDVNNNIIKNHPVLKLLHQPNPANGGAEFFESLYSHKIISGNAYVFANKNSAGEIVELYLFRPDRVEIIPGIGASPKAYSYTIGDKKTIYRVDPVTSKSDVLHLRNFNPLDDWYGLSQIEAASYSIDLHNQSSAWNQALLQNGARPSGALIIKGVDGASSYLSKEQFARLQEQLQEKFMGSVNAGRPLLLEGGLEWKDMSYSPKDMDFLEAKNSAARDIALAFGVPPQLLGIKGDNTYNNMQEARLAFWEETVIPLIDKTVDALNNWLATSFGANFKIGYDAQNISALASKHEMLWNRVQNADFMTNNEKRAAVGLPPV